MSGFENSEIEGLVIHRIGNKLQNEGIAASGKAMHPDEILAPLLLRYFTHPFRTPEFFQFDHPSSLSMNEVYTYSRAIFDTPDALHFQSLNIARHIYGASDHANIKPGELYVAYISNCEIDGEPCDAVGIFKSENKETFLKVFPDNGDFGLERQEGININKLDKGCIIFNMDQDTGYRVLSIDNTNRADHAQYWTKDFLGIRKREDTYYHTNNYMQLCRDFAVEAFPDADRLDQLHLMNASVRYFKEEDSFDRASFQEKVLQQPELISAFEEYRQSYQDERQVHVVDEFDIDSSAVSKLKRVFKSVIKLDKNFHIYVHGNRSLIRKGYDEETGMHYYQVFFREES